MLLQIIKFRPLLNNHNRRRTHSSNWKPRLARNKRRRPSSLAIQCVATLLSECVLTGLQMIFDFPPGYFGFGGDGRNFKRLNPFKDPANPLNLDPFSANAPGMWFCCWLNCTTNSVRQKSGFWSPQTLPGTLHPHMHQSATTPLRHCRLRSSTALQCITQCITFQTQRDLQRDPAWHWSG